MNISDFSDSDGSQNDSSEEQTDKPLPSEPNEEQKKEIARWVAEGMGLSDVQKKINSDYGVVMTYMDVRFLVDDLDLTLVDKEEEKPKDDSTESSDTDLTDDLNPNDGGVTVEVDPVTPPGAMASGSVRFRMDKTKNGLWISLVDLVFQGEEGYKPSEEDVMEFQKQLDSALRGKGF